MLGRLPDMHMDINAVTRSQSNIYKMWKKWDLIKLQRFCKARDTVNRTKQQPTDLEKTFTNPTFHRGLIFNV